MKSDLGWEGYAIRSNQKGKSNAHGANVDIIAHKPDKRGNKLVTIAYLYLALMAILGLVGYYYDEYWILIVALVTGIGGVVVALISRGMHKQHAWVECKNRKGKATFEQMVKFIYEHKDYVASGDKEYKFETKYFTSAPGFVDSALKLALDNGVECYEYKDGKFKKVTYWK